MKRQLWVGSLLAGFPLLFGGGLFPSLRLTFAAPLLVWFYSRAPLLTCLWVSYGVGVLLDLLGSEHAFGLYGLLFSVTSAIWYPRRHWFFIDHLSTIPLLSTLFALTLTVLRSGLSLMGGTLVFSWGWLLTDGIVYPIADGMWGLVWILMVNGSTHQVQPSKGFHMQRPK